ALMAKVTVAGNAVADIFLGLPKIFETKGLRDQQICLPLGQKFETKAHRLSVGGSGANVAAGLAALNQDVVLLSAFSSDALGMYMRQSLEGLGVKLDIHETPESSSVAAI